MCRFLLVSSFSESLEKTEGRLYGMCIPDMVIYLGPTLGSPLVNKPISCKQLCTMKGSFSAAKNSILIDTRNIGKSPF
jgi:hypothetical protein